MPVLVNKYMERYPIKSAIITIRLFRDLWVIKFRMECVAKNKIKPAEIIFIKIFTHTDENTKGKKMLGISLTNK